jgi:putative phosphoesterase
MKVGLMADIHGDYEGFRAALSLFERHGAERVLCAGDVVERGPDADRIVVELKRRGIPSISGNHEHTVLRNQKRWRSSPHIERLRKVGRIVNDETLAYIKALPETLPLTLSGVRVLVAHGVPWSDFLGVFPDSNPKLIKRLYQRFAAQVDVMVLGHTHQPLVVRGEGMIIVNPGSVYGVTLRDSHTCAILTLPQREVTVYDLDSGKPTPYDELNL